MKVCMHNVCFPQLLLMVNKGLPLKRSVECALEPESSAKKLRRSDPISLDPPQQLKRKSVNSSASEVAPPVPNPSKSTQAYWHATG